MTSSTTTVTLDREVAREAKILAAQEGITLKEWVERAMLAWVTRWPKGGTRPKVKDPLSSI